MSHSYSLVYIEEEYTSPTDSSYNSASLLIRRLWRAKRILLAAAAAVLLFIWVLSLSSIGSPTYQQIVQHIPDLPVFNLSISSGLVRPQSFQPCQQIPIPNDFWQATNSQQPFVDIPHLSPVEAGSSVCIRVVIPAQQQSVSLVYMPISDTPWDSVLLDLVGQNTGISIPVKLEMAPHVNNYKPGQAHVYQADVVLRDVDVYTPQGYIEYRQARWNAEGNATLPAFEPENLYIADELQVSVVDTHGDSPYNLNNYLDLPLCDSMDADGRWIHVDNLPFNSSLAPPPDNYNRVWLPYHCQLKRYTHQEFNQCLIDKYPVLHWYGDSNTRRALKKITSNGEWCSQSELLNDRQCLCEDYLEPFTRFNEHSREVFIDIDVDQGGHMPSGWFHPTQAPANKSRIVAFKWDGLTRLNIPVWHERFDLGIVSRYGKPQVAILSLGNWDPAFMTMQDFAIEAEKLVAYVETSYSDEVPLILRTGQYFCCTADPTPWQRKYSRLRNAYFSKYIIDLFIERLGKSRQIKVWDVASLAERRPYAARTEATSCPSNHIRAEMVDVENMILFNGLCN